MAKQKRVWGASMVTMALAVSLSACGNSRNIGPGHPPTAAQNDDMTVDRQNVRGAEQALEAVGLKFKIEAQDSTGAVDYHWDMGFFHAFKSAHPRHPTKAEAKTILKNYSLVAGAYLEKYGSARAGDATTAANRSLSAGERGDVRSKLTLVKKQLRKLGALS